MEFKGILEKLAEGRDLTKEDVALSLDLLFSGSLAESQLSAFLMGMRAKGETAEEMAQMAMAIRRKSVKLETDIEGTVDICGTGGDGARTFNISTTSAFVACGAGVRIAKHGSTFVSGSSGSSDVLEKAGARIDIKPEKSMEILQKTGFCFLHAPLYNSSMRYAMKVRKELGIRTVFNLLGPVVSPLETEYRIMGVYSPDLTEKMAAVLKRLGVKNGMVVNGSGLDEITVTGRTKVTQFRKKSCDTYFIGPEDFGIRRCKLERLQVSSPEQSLMALENVLGGKPGPRRDIVLLNAGAAIHVSGKAESMQDGIEMARGSIDSGKALEKFSLYIEASGGRYGFSG